MPMGLLMRRTGNESSNPSVADEVSDRMLASSSSVSRCSTDEGELSSPTDCSEDSVEIRRTSTNKSHPLPSGIIRPSAIKRVSEHQHPWMMSSNGDPIKRMRRSLSPVPPAASSFPHPPLAPSAGIPALMDLERIGLLQHWAAMKAAASWMQMDHPNPNLFHNNHHHLLPFQHHHHHPPSAASPYFPYLMPYQQSHYAAAASLLPHHHQQPEASTPIPPPPPLLVIPKLENLPKTNNRKIINNNNSKKAAVIPAPSASFSVENLLQKRIQPAEEIKPVITNRPESGSNSPDDGGPGSSSSTVHMTGSRNYKNMTKERRMQANARERTRVHTISAAFEALRRAVPSFSHGQRLSKLSILRVASAYIAALGGLAGDGDDEDNDVMIMNRAVQTVSKTLMTEGQMLRRKHPSSTLPAGRDNNCEDESCDLVDEDM